MSINDPDATVSTDFTFDPFVNSLEARDSDEELEAQEPATEEEEISTTRPVTSVVFGTFEQALKVAGAFGTYQIGFLLSIQVLVVLACGNIVFMSYANYQPHITCFFNETKLELHKTGKATDDEKARNKAFCNAYRVGGCQDENTTWESPFYTVIEEWKMICDEDYLPQMINSIQMAGTVISMIVGGQLADFMGRKFVFYGAFTMMLFAGMLSTLANGPVMFAICRFMVGGMLSASAMANFVWSMELTDQKHNVIVNCAGLWHFAYIITAFLGWCTKDWKTYLIVLNSIGAPLLIIYSCYNESPRWLVQKGQLERAAKVLTKIAKQNRPFHRVQISADNLRGIHTEQSNKQKYGMFALFMTKKLTAFTLVMMTLFVATASAATAFIFQVSQLSGDPFLKFTAYGVLRMWIPFVLYFADRKIKKFGRRLMLLIPLAAVFICYLTVALGVIIVHNSGSIVLYGTLTGAVICNCLWIALGQYMVELFPTVIRNTASAVVGLCDPFIGVIMPQLIYFEKYWPALPFMLVAVSTAVSWVLSYMFLPETKGRVLPDTIEDLDSIEFPFAGMNRADGCSHGSWYQLKSVCTCAEEEALIDNEMDAVNDTFEDDN